MKNKIVFLTIIIAWFSVLTSVNGQFTNELSELRTGVSDGKCSWGRVEIQPGSEFELARFDGAGMITYFYFTDGRGGIVDKNVVLRIYWDGNNFPSVNVPLADFFGSVSNKSVEYESLLLSIRHNCHQSYIPMPFSKGARIVLANDSDKPYIRDVAYNLDIIRDKKYETDKSRFHAQWHRSNPTNGLHTILNVKGRGHYIGNFLHVYTKSNRWWGEGDTDFTIDGKALKHSPGSEDEYGACFEFGSKYSYLTCGYIIGGNLVNSQQEEFSYKGDNLMYRWYTSNPVVFTRELKVTIQNQYNQPGMAYDFKSQYTTNDDYTSVAYYYLEGSQKVELANYSDRIAETKAVVY